MNKFDNTTYDGYEYPVTKETDLWKSCTFVFDTSSLLNLYDYSDNTKRSIVNSIITPLSDRLWIPSHVAHEYLKNRKRVIRNPLNDKYNKLKSEITDNIRKEINKISGQLNELENRVTTQDKHPYVNVDIVKGFIDATTNYKEQYSEFLSKLESEISLREDEINSLLKNDIVLEAVEKYISMGKEYSFNRILNIFKESKYRFQHEIPPGYMDLNDSKKKGIQKIGDLIIWKQIIDFSQEKDSPVVLITNDHKEDWCVSTTYKGRKTIKPREELIREIKSISSNPFWIYSFSDFIFKSRDLLKTNIEDKVIDEIEEKTNPSIEYYVLNTNYSNDSNDHKSMLTEQIAAAYYDPHKYYIDKLNKGDAVFLYQSGTGIVAFGYASGELLTRNYHGEIENEEHYMKLDNFIELKDPITASIIKDVADGNINFRKTMFTIDDRTGKELIDKIYSDHLQNADLFDFFK